MADYVIIGAGSAGCVLAEALSARHSVVVLEAGSGKLPLEVSIPAAFSKLFKTSVDWNLASEPEPGAAGRSLYLPRGKMVGGSSSMNAMLYMRGRPSDFDVWDARGATGWGWETVQAIFRDMESNSRGTDEFHGSRGPMRVEDLRHDMAVVGPDLKVNGVESLWVADASVMPTVTSGNTNAPTMMIGSRAAELISASRWTDIRLAHPTSRQPSKGSSSCGSGR